MANDFLDKELPEDDLIKLERRRKQMAFFKHLNIEVNEENFNESLKAVRILLKEENPKVVIILECLFSLDQETEESKVFSDYNSVENEVKRIFLEKGFSEEVTYGYIYGCRNNGIKNIRKKIEARGGLLKPNTPQRYDYLNNINKTIDLVKQILESNGIRNDDMVLKIANMVTYTNLTIYISRYPLNGSGPVDWSIVAKSTGVTSQYASKCVEELDKIFYDIAGIKKEPVVKKGVGESAIKKQKPSYLLSVFGTEDVDVIKKLLLELKIGDEENSNKIRNIIGYLYPLDGSAPLKKEEVMQMYGLTRHQLIGIIAAGLSYIKKTTVKKARLEEARNQKVWLSFGAKDEEKFNIALNKLSYRERRLFNAMHPQVTDVIMSTEEKAKTLGMGEMKFLAQYRIVEQKLKLIVNLNLDLSKEELELLKKLVNKLNNKLEREVLILILGLNGTYNPLESVAKKVGLTVEETKKLITSAISHLNNPIQDKIKKISE